MKTRSMRVVSSFGALALGVALLLLFPATSPGTLGPARQQLGSLAGQKIEAPFRKEYPPNSVEYDRQGVDLSLRFTFKTGGEDDEFAEERTISCRINEWNSLDLQEKIGLDQCPDGEPARKGSEGPISACLRDDSIEWSGRPSADVTSKRDAISPYGRFMFERGLRCHEGKWVLDYPTLIARATPAFEDCIWSVKNVLGNDAKLLMSFFLAMSYEDVPKIDPERRRWTAGFRVPPALMIRNAGDCDSKAAAFCAIRRTVPGRLVMFRSVQLADHSEQGHAFVGYEVKDSILPYPLRDKGDWKEDDIPAGEYDEIRPLEFWGRSYIPVDVTGPRDIRLGEVVPEKAGRYLAIPIPEDDRIQLASDRTCLKSTK